MKYKKIVISKMSYTIRKSNRIHKKYMAVFDDGRVVHFGDDRYGQYKDKTGLGLYSHLDHLDEKKRLTMQDMEGQSCTR